MANEWTGASVDGYVIGFALGFFLGVLFDRILIPVAEQLADRLWAMRHRVRRGR